ncbi:MAG: cyclic pyranopterin monophosphate synthase MoaC [Dehalococcoidia bacterium]|nr:cyclic pyranopterin monophosphate synthase MoaC [Dehalococcoidia bacterium]
MPDPQDKSATEPSLSHLDEEGKASMVDVGWKPETRREAIARGFVSMQHRTLQLIVDGSFEKGDVLATARLAGIMGAKATSQLIPLCHPIPIDQVAVDLDVDHEAVGIRVTATARTSAKTGVEMEAMTAVSVAALTIYDMCKAVDRGIRLEGIRLVKKTGGKSGDIILEE